MTRNKQEQILKNAGILYKAFPADTITINHKIVIRASELIKRIFEYKGQVKALPKELIELRYEEIWNIHRELENSLERTVIGYTEAKKSLNDAEEILNWIFLGA